MNRDGWTPKVGDVVRFRDWNDMARQYGLSRSGSSIQCTYGFTDAMKYLCGTEFTISEINGYKVAGHNSPFSVSIDMIEPTFDRANWNPEPGETVRVREWSDMASEFGTDDDDDIMCEGTFVYDMRDLCGREFVIEKINEEGCIYGHNFGYTITKDMIEPAFVDQCFYSNGLIDFLNGFHVK